MHWYELYELNGILLVYMIIILDKCMRTLVRRKA
jgi:hypothetical protein